MQFVSFVLVCSVSVCLRSWLCVSLYLVSVCLCIWYLSVFVFGNCVSLYFGLCILVFGYPCMGRKKKGVVRSRSLRTSESAPPSPLHASDLLLRTATYFFCLLLATYFFEHLLRLTAWDVKGYLHNETSFCSYAHFSVPPQKVFTLRSLTLCGKQVLLRHFFTFM